MSRGPDLPVVIVGAGAAGLVAAIFAAGHVGERRRVLLLERTRDGGRKILVSGGGRCNVLPSQLDPTRFVSDSSPNTLRKILLSWPLPEQRRFFEEEVGVELALEPETGKLFPVSNSSRQVRDGLVALARRKGAVIRFDSRVTGISPPDGTGSWSIELDDGERIAAAAVVVATGGLSLPGTGSDGLGFDLVRRLGHTVHPTYPALTPLTLNPPRYAGLAGISLEVTLRAPLPRGSWSTHGGFLFTHRGYSGPSVLDISHLAVRSRTAGGPLQPLHAQWTDLDAEAWDARLREGTGTVIGALRRYLPDRLAEMLLTEARVDGSRPLAQLRREDRRKLIDLLTAFLLPWNGDEGYRKAEVTGGGVALSEVAPNTLESRLHPGLFLCGEILDAFGPIGGYNFAWAWATGRAAGLGAAERSLS
ncbi:MAG TPA: aminoacetone oxidase family FAD-binding enzyme [Thermoanaerobaculia bacterium]|nr:aminoacetone oxidase family FAD-binding enzyme [Thermoanaerobaculia bacterium]